MKKLYTVSKNKQINKKTPGIDCGSDHQLFSTKFGLRLKKVEETTRPFRYAINQMAYDSVVEVTKCYIWYTESLENYGQRFIMYRKQ